MAIKLQQLENGIEVLEAQRAILGDGLVDVPLFAKPPLRCSLLFLVDTPLPLWQQMLNRSFAILKRG